MTDGFDWTPYGRHTPMFDWAGQTVRARLVTAHDGDTCRVVFQTEYGVKQFIIRVEGIDSPEIASKDPAEKEHALAARDMFLELAAPGVFNRNDRHDAHNIERLLQQNETLVTVVLGKYDKYGRLLATIVSDAGVDIGKHLVSCGAAHPYFGKTKEPWYWA